jgi:hypothetical protein
MLSVIFIGDWLLGMNATRLYTVNMVVLSRYYLLTCTNPTLAMVVDRFKEIENFKPSTLIGNCKPCTEKRCLIMMMVDFLKKTDKFSR